MAARKLLAVLSTLGLGLAGAAVVTEPASATANKWCNSSNSETTFSVRTNYGNWWTVYPDYCYYPSTGEKVVMGADSYRVGYNYGPYSSCRRGDVTFTPWADANVIYFKTYRFGDCDPA